MIPVADLKAMAAPRILELAQELAPGGKVTGDYWLARSPLRADKHAGSFAIWVRGAAVGAWKDFASDEKGDLVDLIAAVKYGGVDRAQRADAIKWLRRFLGLADVSPAVLSVNRALARRAQKAAEARAQAEAEAKRRNAFELFLRGKPLGGTLGEVYLAERGIFPRDIPRLCSTFRFFEALDYWRADTRWRGPAILGRYRDVNGLTVALHGTWLSADGRGKADLSPPKLSLGSYKGHFLPITRGWTGQEVWENACRPSPCAVTEGPEDGWSVAQSDPSLRVWAAGSLSNIGNLPKHPAISAYLVARQNDWQTPAAVAAFERAIDALRAHTPVSVISCGFGKDPNDQLRGMG